MAGEKTSLRDVVVFFEYFKIKDDVIKLTEVLCSHFSTCSLVTYWFYSSGTREA